MRRSIPNSRGLVHFLLGIGLFVALPLSARAQKTLCTVTLNSTEEKQVFTRHLIKDFKVVELVTDKSDWFKAACDQKIQCDVLLISGHFGGSFFGKGGTLTTAALEQNSCQSSCDGILKRPKEVFLFGCNTLAGKGKDRRTLEEYVRVLTADGFSRLEAEQVAAFRYSPLGSSFHDRMTRVFANAEKIYGFDSIAPSGMNVQGYLDTYLRSIGSYPIHLENMTRKPNDKLARALWETSFTETRGIHRQSRDIPSCLLHLTDVTRLEKVKWIWDSISDPKKRLEFATTIASFLKTAETEKYQWTPEERLILQEITDNTAARQDIEAMLRKPIAGLLSVQVTLMSLAQQLRWWTNVDYQAGLKRIFQDMFSRNLNIENADLICSLDVQILLTKELLPKDPWTVPTIRAVGCARPADEHVHIDLAKLAMSAPNKELRDEARYSFSKLSPPHPRAYSLLISALQQGTRRVRLGAAEVLGMKTAAPRAIESLIIQSLSETLNDPDQEILAMVVRSLGHWQVKDPLILEKITSFLLDRRDGVRLAAADALLEIAPDSSAIHTALLEAFRKESDTKIRRQIFQVLELVKPKDPEIFWALMDLLPNLPPLGEPQLFGEGSEFYDKMRLAALLTSLKPKNDPRVERTLLKLLQSAETELPALAILIDFKFPSISSRSVVAEKGDLDTKPEAIRKSVVKLIQSTTRLYNELESIPLAQAIQRYVPGRYVLIQGIIANLKTSDPAIQHLMLDFLEVIRETRKGDYGLDQRAFLDELRKVMSFQQPRDAGVINRIQKLDPILYQELRSR